MRRIVFKDGFAFLYLCREFYSKDSVLRVAKVYKDFFESAISEVGGYFVLRVSEVCGGYSLDEVCFECLNYLIAMEFERK